ncbi:MAG: DUF5666 domain-containing protein [Pseudomonadota bacterium]
MIRLTRRALLAGTGAALVGACTEGADIAGTKKQPKGGIGGTGIIGTLTDFGSLMVNGLRVSVPEDLMIETAMGNRPQSALTVGQNLTIEATTTENGLTAMRVRMMHPLIGALEEESEDGRRLIVAGVPVRVEDGATIDQGPDRFVAVSGTWRGTEVVASRIAPASVGVGTSVAGTLRHNAQTLQSSIGAVPVALPKGINLESGSFATAFGTMSDGVLQVATIQGGRFTGAAGPLVALSVEGYFAPTPTAPFYTIDGLGHQLSAGSALTGLLGNRALLTGSYNGRFVVRNGTVLPDSFSERRARLRA